VAADLGIEEDKQRTVADRRSRDHTEGVALGEEGTLDQVARPDTARGS
jgi:hypothetical protein